MQQSEIEKKLSLLDGRGSGAEYDAIESLNELGDRLPELLLEKYRHSKKWGERISCVYHAIKYAKANKAAYQLGIEAIRDKSKKVRYRACMLLAVSQNKSSIAALEQLLNDKDSSEYAAAAIDAIENDNHHYFVDRDHSDMVTLNV